MRRLRRTARAYWLVAALPVVFVSLPLRLVVVAAACVVTALDWLDRQLHAALERCFEPAQLIPDPRRRRPRRRRA